MLGRAADALQVIGDVGFLARLFLEQHVAEADDGVQRGAQLVAGGGKKLALEPAGGLGQIPGALPRLGLMAATQVAGIVEGLGDRRAEIVQIDGLDLEIKRAAVHGRAQIGHIAVGGHDDGGRKRGKRPQAAQQREPVHLGHVDVREDEIHGQSGLQLGEGLQPVGGEDKLDFLGAQFAPEGLPQHRFHIRLVIHHQDADRGGLLDIRLHGCGEAGRRGCVYQILVRTKRPVPPAGRSLTANSR